MANPTGKNQYTGFSGRSQYSRSETRSHINRIITGKKGTLRGDAQRMMLADDLKALAKKLGGNKHKAVANLAKLSVMRADRRNAR